MLYAYLCYFDNYLSLFIYRQENLSMSMKLNAVERRSRELLLAQGAAMSGAAVALSGLGTRLEGLVDQLIASYNISVKDLEVSTLIEFSLHTKHFTARLLADC